MNRIITTVAGAMFVVGALGACTTPTTPETATTTAMTVPAPSRDYTELEDKYSSEQIEAALKINAYWESASQAERQALCVEYVVDRDQFKEDFLSGYGSGSDPAVWWAAVEALVKSKCVYGG